MMRNFKPSSRYRALLLADALAFAAFYLLPQFEVIESPAALSALDLDGLGGLVALAHPLSITVHTTVRLASVGFLFVGHWLGPYFFFAAVLLSGVSAAIGGLAVLTALDHLALTLLCVLDGYLLCRTIHLRAFGEARDA